MKEGYSPLAKIFRLAAYKRAWSHCGSVTLEGKQHSVVFLHSRAASLRALRLKCEPPFCDSESHRGRFKSSHTSAKETKKQPSFWGSVVLLFGAGRGIRTPVPFGQTVFKTFRILPESSRIIPKPPRFSARFRLFLAPSRKFARKLREACEKLLKIT